MRIHNVTGVSDNDDNVIISTLHSNIELDSKEFWSIELIYVQADNSYIADIQSHLL